MARRGMPGNEIAQGNLIMSLIATRTLTWSALVGLYALSPLAGIAALSALFGFVARGVYRPAYARSQSRS